MFSHLDVHIKPPQHRLVTLDYQKEYCSHFASSTNLFHNRSMQLRQSPTDAVTCFYGKEILSKAMSCLRFSDGIG